MAAPESTNLQVNFKTRAGTLINVYATDEADLSAKLGSIESVAPQISALEGVLNAGSAAASITAPPSQQGSRPPFDSAPGGGSASPSCVHGVRVFRKGVSKAGKPYEAWFCPSTDRNAQCKPEWA